jgi:uncharacterized membrane protein
MKSGAQEERGMIHRWPHPPSVLAAFFGVLVVLAVLVEVRAAGLAFTLAGLSPAWSLAALLASLLGSAINIPVARLRTPPARVEYVEVRYFGIVHLVPVGRPGQVIVAVNVGGALVPTAVSLFLIQHADLWVVAPAAIGFVAAIVHLAARPVPGFGILIPMFVPAVAAVAVALLLAGHAQTGALAYVAGSMGTLIGGDLSNARWFRRMRARFLSIGGAGTFDGIFLAGILAVILAAFF